MAQVIGKEIKDEFGQFKTKWFVVDRGTDVLEPGHRSYETRDAAIEAHAPRFLTKKQIKVLEEAGELKSEVNILEEKNQKLIDQMSAMYEKLKVIEAKEKVEAKEIALTNAPEGVKAAIPGKAEAVEKAKKSNKETK